MVTYISSWARQIIVSVVIAIILEMVLSPNSKSTKYIKTVIGIYVVYTIIVPGIKLVSGKSLDFTSIDYENYFINSDIYKELENNVIEVENSSFEESYKLNLKQDIENKLREKGFIVSNINLKVNLEENSQEYGEIKEIEINLSKKQEDKSDNKENQISIDKIKIGDQEKNKDIENSLKETEKMDVKEFISEEYGVDINKISIN